MSSRECSELSARLRHRVGPRPEIRDATRFELVRLTEKVSIDDQMTAVYPLADAAKAQRELIAGHTHGKIVLVP